MQPWSSSHLLLPRRGPCGVPASSCLSYDSLGWGQLVMGAVGHGGGYRGPGIKALTNGLSSHKMWQRVGWGGAEPSRCYIPAT